MSPKNSDDPQPGAYRPYVAARRPGGNPENKPAWRVVVHHKFLTLWNDLVVRCGLQQAQQLWDYLAFQPDKPSPYGNVSLMKGKHMRGKDGWSGVRHYEITGAGRVDFQHNPRFTNGAQGDEHSVVRIIGIDLSSH